MIQPASSLPESRSEHLHAAPRPATGITFDRAQLRYFDPGERPVLDTFLPYRTKVRKVSKGSIWPVSANNTDGSKSSIVSFRQAITGWPHSGLRRYIQMKHGCAKFNSGQKRC
jgi:hypothetical protein